MSRLVAVMDAVFDSPALASAMLAVGLLGALAADDGFWAAAGFAVSGFWFVRLVYTLRSRPELDRRRRDQLALAASRLLCACWAADAQEELPGEVDGALMDGVARTLRAIGYPDCVACRGTGGEEEGPVCRACKGLGLRLPLEALP